MWKPENNLGHGLQELQQLPLRQGLSFALTYLVGGGGCLCYKVHIEAIGQLSQECFLFYHVSSGNQIQVVRLCRRHTDSSSLLALKKKSLSSS